MRVNLFNEPLSSTGHILGCTSCPLDKIPGVRKVKGLVRITGRRAFLWAQSPGRIENDKGLELVGDSGQLLWTALKVHGLDRNTFDIQNTLRCRPLSIDGTEHAPTKQELLSCSVYNDEALSLNKGRAKVHLILGDVAGSQLLGKAFRKDKPVLWYAPWDAYIVLANHPAYIIRQGGEKAGWDYHTWVIRLGAVRAILDYPGRYGFLKAQNYSAVKTAEEFDAMERVIRTEAKTRRVSFDIEDDVVDGKRHLLIAGFGIGHFRDRKDMSSWTGHSWAVILDHPESGYSYEHLKIMQGRVKNLIEDVSIRKTLQNGSYDENTCRETLGAKLRGYDYDTQYGTYLRYSFLRSCSLENLTYLFFPEFCDYKSIVEPWEKTGFSKAPLEQLVLRNCGDTDLTKRLEERFSPDVPQALVKVYIRAGKQLDKMERRGPILDRKLWEKAEAAVPNMMKNLDRRLQRIADDENFDCDSPQQVAHLIYDTLGIEETEAGRSTRQPVLDILAANSGNSVFDLIQKRRTLSKTKSTYLRGYMNSARLHDDELRTIWWLTGAVTGRLRSGKGDKAEAEGIVNFQNLSGEPLLQNLLVSDKGWRRALKETNDILDQEVFLAADGKQIEIRALAELSGDPVMIRLLQEAAKDRNNPNKDFHALNGNMLTGWDVERLVKDKTIRRVIKNLIFGIVFGKGEDGMYDYVVAKMREGEGSQADISGISRKRTVQLYRKFFSVYKGVRKFMTDQRAKAESLGFVETLFGFRRHIRQNDSERGSWWGNQSINSPVQGTAHQFVLICLALLDLKPNTYCHLQKCIMEVHDALYFRVKVRHLQEAHKQLMHLFETGTVTYAEQEFRLKLRVPILAEAEAGMCMGSMVPYNGEPLDEFLTAWRKKHHETETRNWEDLMPVLSVDTQS